MLIPSVRLIVVVASYAGLMLAVACENAREPLTPLVQACNISPDTLDFGPTFLQQQRLKKFTITNEGTDSLELKATALSNPFFMVFLDTTSFTLAPGESRTATIKFGPQTEGLHSRTIRFGNDACPAVYCVGDGVIVPVTGCEVYPRSINFGWVDLSGPLVFLGAQWRTTT